MALPTLVNGQITDAITQSSVATIAAAPAIATAAIYQSSAHSISILYQNAVQAQQLAAICGQASTNMGVIQIYSAGTMAGAAATAKIAQSSSADNLLAALAVLRALG